MSPVVVALVAENAVIALIVAAGWSLLRQGGGLQVKPVPVPKNGAQAPVDSAGGTGHG